MSVSKFITALEKLLDNEAKRVIAERIKLESEGEDDVEVYSPEPEDQVEEEVTDAENYDDTVAEQDGDVAGDDSEVDVSGDADSAQSGESYPEMELLSDSEEMEPDEEVSESDVDFTEFDEMCKEMDDLGDEEEVTEMDDEGDLVIDSEDESVVDGSNLEGDEDGTIGF